MEIVAGVKRVQRKYGIKKVPIQISNGPVTTVQTSVQDGNILMAHVLNLRKFTVDLLLQTESECQEIIVEFLFSFQEQLEATVALAFQRILL